jgi:RNA polymerase sigma-32 factor
VEINVSKENQKKALEGEVVVEQSSNSTENDHDSDYIDIDNLTDDEQIEVLEELLPTKATSTSLTSVDGKSITSLHTYIKEISKYKLLSREEEAQLVKQLNETGDIAVAKKLVLANLRLVVKIALEYKNAYKNVMDLIQEGNIGLMKAVSKYNPEKGAKLSYYASWWIKSYILKFILDNFRLVKIGTTQEQKKLFYNLMREKERLMNQGIEPEYKLLSENLGVSEKAVKEMDLRLSSQGNEVSIDAKKKEEESGGRILDTLESSDIPIDDSLAELQSLEILEENLENFIAGLKDRDKEIFKKRLLTEVPPSLQSIADDYGVSRERIRQIEARLIEKLKVYMSDFLS